MQRLTRSVRRHLNLWIVFAAGVLLRFQYFLSTPIEARAHDLHAHIDYIMHMMESWTVPLTSSGWEMHQPPLYYFLTASVLRFKELLGFSSVQADITQLSLVLSIATLLAAFWIALQLFPKPKQELQAQLFLGIIATLPGIVFLAGRVTNDTLTTLLMFVFTAALLDWWKRGTARRWYLCVVLAALGILTKFNVVVTLPVLAVCLWSRCDIRTRKKWELAIGGAVTLCLLTGWLFLLRMQDGAVQHLLTPGTSGLNGLLRVPNGVVELFSFSPLRILQTTYNDPWTDTLGRKYFWEFFFKSAFFGEWQFWKGLQWLHRFMLAGGLFILLMAAVGIVRDVRRRGPFRLPLLLTLGTGLAILFALRALRNAACSQDFRFVPHIIIPVAMYACLGLDALSQRWRRVATVILTIFCVLCGMFLLSLSL